MLLNLAYLAPKKGVVVHKGVNANPGLKVNRTKVFLIQKMLFMAYVLYSLGLFKLKTEG